MHLSPALNLEGRLTERRSAFGALMQTYGNIQLDIDQSKSNRLAYNSRVDCFICLFFLPKGYLRNDYSRKDQHAAQISAQDHLLL